MKETLIVLSVKKKKKNPWIRGEKRCEMANTFESEIRK